MSLLIFIYSLLYTTLAWMRLDWAVLILIASLPAYLIRFSVFGIPSSLLEAMILIVFIVWIVKNRKQELAKIKLAFQKNRKTQKINYPFYREIIAVLVISFVSAGIGGFSAGALGIWKAYFFEPILLFIVIINITSLKSLKLKAYKVLSLESLIYALTTSAFLVSIFAIFQRLTGSGLPAEWVGQGRVTSFFPYPNAVGLYLAPIALLVLGLLAKKLAFLQAKINFKNAKALIANYKLALGEILFLKLTIFLSVLAIYFAKSEGALAGIAGGLIIFGLLIGKKTRLITLGLLIFASFFIFTNAPAKNYFIEKITFKDLSGEIRKQQWKETFDMLKDGRILLGSGLDNYKPSLKPYHQDGIFFNHDNGPDFRRKIVIFDEKYKAKYWQPTEIYLYPHNILLNFWAELGVFGLILFIWIIGKFIYLALKINKNPVALGLSCAMIAIAVHGLVDVPYFKNDLAALFWVILAMIGILYLTPNNKKNTRY